MEELGPCLNGLRILFLVALSICPLNGLDISGIVRTAGVVGRKCVWAHN